MVIDLKIYIISYFSIYSGFHRLCYPILHQINRTAKPEFGEIFFLYLKRADLRATKLKNLYVLTLTFQIVQKEKSMEFASEE